MDGVFGMNDGWVVVLTQDIVTDGERVRYDGAGAGARRGVCMCQIGDMLHVSIGQRWN